MSGFDGRNESDSSTTRHTLSLELRLMSFVLANLVIRVCETVSNVQRRPVSALAIGWMSDRLAQRARAFVCVLCVSMANLEQSS